jgi:pimeloyl-ACP methyl ester carboxylesterase
VRINVRHTNMTIASEARQIEICGHSIRVVMRGAGCGGTPLLLFNGIGGNIELLQPFIEALGEIEAVVFDIPGVGASSEPLLPYRLRTMAHLADRLMTKLGYEEEFDVFGVSWGGALAQQFAFQYGRRCRRLVLAATSQGMLMVPGRLRSLLKMASPRRFADGQFSLPHRWFWTDDVTARAIGVDWPSRAVIDVVSSARSSQEAASGRRRRARPRG